MSGDERRLLEEGRERLRGVLSALTAPGGNPISPLFRRAGQPDLWSGAWQANAVGFLQVTQWWVGDRLPDGLNLVVAWLDQRITQLDDYQRALAPGVEATPPAPPPLLYGAPSAPPPPPSSWSGGGFSGMDPGQVKRFCHDIDATAEGIAQLGATARAALDDMAGFLPAHAKETAGTSRFDEVRDMLQQVARELRRRATLMEEAFIVSSLFGAPLPILGLVAAHVPPPAPAPPAVAGPPAPPPSQSFLDGSALACLADGKLDGEERRRALRLLKAACARAKGDPRSAADLVNGVGPEALGQLLETNDAIRKELGCVLGPASGTGRLGFDVRAVFLDHAERLGPDDTLALLEVGRFDPSWVIGYAEQFFSVPVARPTKYYFDRVERTVRLLGRDQATAFAAATDPDIARSLGGLINHLDAGVRRAAQAVARNGLLPPPEDHDQLVAARDAMEAIILRTCDHPRPSGAARRLVADFLAVNMADLALLATYDEGGDGRLPPDELSLSRPEYERALAVACQDAAGRAAVLASSTAQLAAVAAEGSGAIAAGLTAGADLEGVKALARSAASTLKDQLRELGAHLGELGKVNLDVLDDRKRAAKEIATAIGVVGSVLLAGGGMAAGAAGGALKAADTLGGPVASETVTQLTEALEKRLVAADVTNATEFMAAINSTIETVMVVALYNQTDAAGGHPLRDHLGALGMGPPPDRFLDAEGNLVLPAPLSGDAQGRLDEWLKPAKAANPLYEVSHTFVHDAGGLSDTLTEELVRHLYNRGVKE